MRRFAVPLAALAVAIPLVAGCGGGGGDESSTTTSSTTTEATSSATDWANGFCSAFKDWSSTMTGIGQDLQGNPTKDNLQATGDKIRGANDDLADGLETLGRPDIDNGDQAKDVVDRLGDQIRSDSDQIAGALTNIANATDIVAAASTITTSLTTLQTQVNNALSELKRIGASQKEALKEALANATSCQSVTG